MNVEEMDKRIRLISDYSEYIGDEIKSTAKLLSEAVYVDEWAMKMMIESLEDAVTILSDYKRLSESLGTIEDQMVKRRIYEVK